MLNKRMKSKPILMLQSDDWGRVGISHLNSLEKLYKLNLIEKKTLWDKYGLESKKDLNDLKNVLLELKDHKGKNLEITTNIIFANLDLYKSKKTNFKELVYLPIKDGFPDPWKENLKDKYKELLKQKVLYPSLHGYTHFNYFFLKDRMKNNLEFRKRITLLFNENIQYLSSYTPEINFALVNREEGKETYIQPKYQQEWIEKGIREFKDIFGFQPVTTCAPGYRFNDTTLDLWEKNGIKIIQTGTNDFIRKRKKILLLPRTLHFEPIFNQDDRAIINTAIEKVSTILEEKKPVIISSHSINFIEKFNFGKKRTLNLLTELITKIKEICPEIEFINEHTLLRNYMKYEIGTKMSYFLRD